MDPTRPVGIVGGRGVGVYISLDVRWLADLLKYKYHLIHTVHSESTDRYKVKQSGYRPGVAQRVPGS
jgi:hypothetical protein